MTDKELKKLSRLELLELLLDVSKENEELKENIEKLKEETERVKNIASLSLTTRQLNTALEQVQGMIDNLFEKIDVSASLKEITDSRKDMNLYCEILSYYAKNSDSLENLPESLRKNVKEKIRDILNL